MSDFGEALGTAVEGSLLSRAFGGKRGALVDKDGKPIEEGHFAEGECLNCGTELQGAHCHACGQKAHLHRTIGAFFHDLLHGALHLDGKTWRTLPKLIFKPGELTRRYIEGERAKFVSPMAIFLFSVFLMFAVFQALGISAPTDIQPSEERRAEIEEAGAAARSEADETRARLEEQLEGLPADDPMRAELEADLRNLDAAEVILGGAENVVLGETAVPAAQFSAEQTGVAFVDNAIGKWRSNPGLMLYKLQTNAYKFSWMLIPLSVPFVWSLFFWKRRFKAYDHAIFVTYSITFMSLLFIALSLLTALGIGGGWVFTALAIIPPIHIYKQLRGTYQLGRIGALIRTVLLLAMIIFGVSFLFLWLMLALGAF